MILIIPKNPIILIILILIIPFLIPDWNAAETPGIPIDLTCGKIGGLQNP